MKKNYQVSLKQIPNFAKEIANKIQGGEIFALVGPLGSGKTAFAKALGKELKIKNKITSPTFSLLNCYPVRINTGKNIFVYHLDLYRTKNFKEVQSLGLTEFWGQNQTLTLIEWADKIRKYWPKKTQVIKFQDR